MLDCNAPIAKQQEDVHTLHNSFETTLQQIIQALVASGKLSSHRKPDKVYFYQNATGTTIGAVLRWDVQHQDGSKSKIIQPVAWDEKDNTWKHCGMPTPRPLYALPKIVTASLEVPIIVVEGEKCADAGNCYLGSIAIFTTSAHGANAAHGTDWSPLSGRKVYIWPDHDPNGHKYAETVAKLAKQAEAKYVAILNPTVIAGQEPPPKWDVADAVQECQGDETKLNQLRERLLAAMQSAHEWWELGSDDNPFEITFDYANCKTCYVSVRYNKQTILPSTKCEPTSPWWRREIVKLAASKWQAYASINKLAVADSERLGQLLLQHLERDLDLAANNIRIKSGAQNEPERNGQLQTTDRQAEFIVADQPGYHREYFLSRPGVYYVGDRIAKWISSPIYVEAITCDSNGHNFGRLIKYQDSLGRWRECLLPMRLLAGAGNELCEYLLDLGVEIAPKLAGHYLALYLQAQKPGRQLECATRIGWHRDSFVLPDKIYGPKADRIVFQNYDIAESELLNTFATAGTLYDWQRYIAAKAVGNPNLVLAISAAFAGPLIGKCQAENAGLHLIGDSSIGKTTIALAAWSVWGPPKHCRSWRVTANGLEGLAALSNDCLLVLDDISQCDPFALDEIIYMLVNGIGKQRANQRGMARPVSRWRCVVLSTGERSIETILAQAGKQLKAGQTVRMLDVPFVGKYGAFDELHNHTSGSEFADALKSAATKYHGVAGREFLRKLANDEGDLAELYECAIEKFHSLLDVAPISGQEKRVAAKFALIALAGELATEYEITKWPQNIAFDAAIRAFRAWQSWRGQGNAERQQIVRALAEFLERHGDSRFTKLDSELGTEVEVSVRDRAGWYYDTDGTSGKPERIYLFAASGLREALRDFDFRRALDVLAEEGVLPQPDAAGKHTRFRRIAGRGMHLYPVHFNRLSEIVYGR
jgi:putative DNA primase/helicase